MAQLAATCGKLRIRSFCVFLSKHPNCRGLCFIDRPLSIGGYPYTIDPYAIESVGLGIDPYIGVYASGTGVYPIGVYPCRRGVYIGVYASEGGVYTIGVPPKRIGVYA